MLIACWIAGFTTFSLIMKIFADPILKELRLSTDIQQKCLSALTEQNLRRSNEYHSSDQESLEVLEVVSK
jgi:hypothetical protein